MNLTGGPGRTVRHHRFTTTLAHLLACVAGLCATLLLSAQNQPSNRIAHSTSTPPAVLPPPDVAKPPADAVASASGIVTKVLKSGDGLQHPDTEDCVILRFVAWTRQGALFSTSGTHGETTVQCLPHAIPGIAEAVRTMVVGESCRVWVPAELAFASHFAHHGTKKMHEKTDIKVDLTFDLELVGILKAARPPADLRAPPSTALKTPTGVAMEILRPGTGVEHPTPTSRVKLNYSLWTSDGTLFESTSMSGNPVSFQIGLAIPGWREALPRMVVGEKARIWIPAALAYGDHPPDKLVPAGNLVYEVELLEIQPN